MTKFTAGQFEIEVGPPSPRWVEVWTRDLNGDSVNFRFHPDALPDLAHVVARALKETT